MSTNYTKLLFYITAEAATRGILEKKIIFRNSCSVICQVKVLAKYILKSSFSVQLEAFNRFQWLLLYYYFEENTFSIKCGYKRKEI